MFFSIEIRNLKRQEYYFSMLLGLAMYYLLNSPTINSTEREYKMTPKVIMQNQTISTIGGFCVTKYSNGKITATKSIILSNLAISLFIFFFRSNSKRPHCSEFLLLDYWKPKKKKRLHCFTHTMETAFGWL